MNKYLYLLMGLLIFVNSITNSHAGEAKPEDSKNILSDQRREVVDEFFRLLDSGNESTIKTTDLLFKGLNDVRTCLLESARFKNDPTPITSFVQSISEVILGQDEKITEVILYGPTHARSSGKAAVQEHSGNSLVAVANLQRERVGPSMLVVFFEFAPNSEQLLVSPVFIKAKSTFSLYDLALRERDSSN